ncbi:MAG: hypothetical protein ACP5NW_00140 [Candidatus Woesearchaeota archaeon]
MDIKKVAMILSITVLLPLFVGLFTDAVYQEPEYENYCNNTYYDYPKTIPATPVNCTDVYMTPEVQKCNNEKGMPEFKYDENNCQEFRSCNYCNLAFDEARQKYNRNIFFVLLPLGLIIVILGIYLTVDYLGAGLMFAGLIVMFYATMRYFSDMSKILRALVILVELLVIMWIGYKKIEHKTGPFDDIPRKINKSAGIKKKKGR